MDDSLLRPRTHLRLRRDGGIVEVRLAREAARNALDRMLMQELIDVGRELRLRSDVLAVVLAGADAYFCAGADLSSIGERIKAPTLLESREAVMLGPDLCRAWEEIEAVTIAAIEGFCLGGGCALAVACDFRIMGEGAWMRLPEVPLGINMSWRSVPRIAALAGPSRAKRFVIFGEKADAQTCERWGLADEVCAKGQALERAWDWARRVVALPPIPVRMTKEAVNATVNANHHATAVMDRDQYLLTSRSADFAEGVRAFFEKRDPRFSGD